MSNITTKKEVSMGFGNLESFELMQRAAKLLSNSTLVPAQYRAQIEQGYGSEKKLVDNPNALPNTVVALNMAQRMGADPLMVMQNLYVIEGRPSWSSQWIIAAINGCGRFSPLRFDIKPVGKKTVEYTEYVWENRQRREVKKSIEIEDIECIAWATEKETGQRIESPIVSIKMSVVEGWYTKNNSKWQTMPEVMLRYRSASFFGKLYAPELLMGIASVEEAQDIAERDMGDVEYAEPLHPSEPVTKEEAVQELPHYTDEEFKKLVPQWLNWIESGKIKAEGIIAKVETKYQLSDEQRETILSLGKESEQEEIEASNVNHVEAVDADFVEVTNE